MSNSQGVDGKTIAIICYITFIGWIIAYILNGTTRSPLASFHLRQYLGIILLGVVISIAAGVIPFLGFLGIGVLILWVIGLISAINGEQKPVPFVGEYFQEWFSGL